MGFSSSKRRKTTKNGEKTAKNADFRASSPSRPPVDAEPLRETQKFERSIPHETHAKRFYNTQTVADVRGDDFVSALTSLFRDIGSALDANRDAVVETFGQLAMLDVAAALHAECDVYGARVLRAYSQHRRLGALMQQTNALQSPDKSLNASLATSTTAAATAAAGAVDPRQVEQYLDEVLVLAQLCDEYNQYVLAAMAEATAPEPLGAARENAFRSGMFNQTVRELLSYYIQMEEYYMDRNVKTAIAIDEWTPGAPITSMVDDVFFIVQKCGRRGLSTSNVQCACAVLSQGNTLLATELRAALDGNWKVSGLLGPAATMRRERRGTERVRRTESTKTKMRRC